MLTGEMVGFRPASWGQLTATWPLSEAAFPLAEPVRVPKNVPLNVWAVPSKLQLFRAPEMTSVTLCATLVRPGKLWIDPVQLRHSSVGAKPFGWALDCAAKALDAPAVERATAPATMAARAA